MNAVFALEFRKNLYSFFIIRFFFLFALILVFLVLPIIKEEHSWLFSPSNKLLLITIFIFIILNAASIMINRWLADSVLTVFAYAEFFFEILFWAAVSYLTGGIQSPFLYATIIIIIYSGIILEEKGAFFTTILAFSLLALQGINDEKSSSKLFIYLVFFSLTGAIASRISKRFQRINRELAQRDHMNEELKKQFFSIFSNINMGIIIVLDSKIIYVNNYAEQFSSKLQQTIDTFLADVKIYRNWVEIRIEEKYFNYMVMPYLEGQTVVLFTDITEMKLKEEDIQRKEKMAAVGHLTASIAHEIKNPLTSLIGASELIFSSFQSPDDDSLQLITIIRREGTRVKKLLDNLFNYTEERKLVFSPVRIKGIIDDMVKIFRATYPDIDFDHRVEDITILGDPDRLKEVFWNVLINSVEAMSEKGRIELYSMRERGRLNIYLRDEGGGIPDGNLEKIFNPFFSTKRRGTGLGLALVYKVIKMHSGDIKVRNYGKGAEFCLSFPLKDGDLIG